MKELAGKLWSPKRKAEEAINALISDFMQQDSYFKVVSALFLLSVIVNFAAFGLRQNMFLTVMGIAFTVILNLKLLSQK